MQGLAFRRNHTCMYPSKAYIIVEIQTALPHIYSILIYIFSELEMFVSSPKEIQNISIMVTCMHNVHALLYRLLLMEM